MRVHIRRSFGSTSSFPAWKPLDYFHHEVLHTSKRSRARVGVIHTPHGPIETPGFVPVGTNGALKFVDHRDADAAGMQLMFSNTLHLLVHPGVDVVRSAGGLHRFIGRPNQPLITDSGGFQIFSFGNPGALAMPGGQGVGDADGDANGDGDGDANGDGDGDADDGGGGTGCQELKSSRHPAARNKWAGSGGGLERVTEQGVHFRSYRDGSRLFLSPETSVEAQKALGADIIIPLDELPPAREAPAKLEASVQRTHRWEERSLATHLRERQQQAMYAVIHGGTSERLRRASLEHLTALPFDGWALGGSLGADRQEFGALMRFMLPLVPRERPCHLLGIGDLESIELSVQLGVDTFDSCFPTRMGRHGGLLTRAGRLKIGRSCFRDDYGPVDPQCDGYVSSNYSRAYLHHLWKAREPLVHGLLTLHNIQFMMDYMRGIRQRILRGEV
jgi:queuine tRNA-ribosyltransferase